MKQHDIIHRQDAKDAKNGNKKILCFKSETQKLIWFGFTWRTWRDASLSPKGTHRGGENFVSSGGFHVFG
jgi:hypothetical protein